MPGFPANDRPPCFFAIKGAPSESDWAAGHGKRAGILCQFVTRSWSRPCGRMVLFDHLYSTIFSWTSRTPSVL